MAERMVQPRTREVIEAELAELRTSLQQATDNQFNKVPTSQGLMLEDTGMVDSSYISSLNERIATLETELESFT